MKKILFLITAIAFNISAKMDLDSKIFVVAGHRGLVGSAILRITTISDIADFKGAPRKLLDVDLAKKIGKC